MRLLVHDHRPEHFLDLLEAHCADDEIRFHRTYAGLDAAVADFAPEVVLSQKFAGVPYPREPLVACRSLGWIHVMGAGVDHLVPWDPARLTVTNSAGTQTECMAQYVLGCVFAFGFDLLGYRRDQAARRWAPREVTSAVGRTMVVVGLGTIGREVARHARAVGMRVVGVRASGRPVDGVDEVLPPARLHEALARADAVVVLVPLTERNRGLFDARTIAAIKPGAVLVNVARGGIVDEAALADALARGHVAGAACDVFAREPLPETSPLWDVENLIITPHVSSVFTGWERACVEVFCANLARRRAGEPLENVVELARGY